MRVIASTKIILIIKQRQHRLINTTSFLANNLLDTNVRFIEKTSYFKFFK